MKKPKSIKCILIVIALLLIVVVKGFSVGYKMIVNHVWGMSIYCVEKVDSVTFMDDSIHIFSNGDTFSCNDILNISFSEEEFDNTVYLLWKGDSVEYKNQNADDVRIKIDKGHVSILSSGKAVLNIEIEGYTENGSLAITSSSGVNINSNGIVLRNDSKEAINVQSKNTTTLYCNGRTVIADGKSRHSGDKSLCNACFYTQENLIIKGKDSLFVTGNYKHAIQSNKEISADANIKILSAVGSGIKAKKLMTVEGGSIGLENIGNNGIDVEKGDFVFNNGKIDVCLTANDTKGIKADSLYIQNGGCLSLDISGNQCKGIKTKKDIRVLGGEVTGMASGGVVITNGDPSYCTFLKCDGDIVFNDAHLDLLHNGEGGKCISADGDVKFSNATLTAKLTGNGGWYINKKGEDDYYTPRAIEANDSLTIVSGKIDINCTGIGGKGMVCDHDLTIGELYGDNDKLHINIITEGTSIVNDTIADFRKGCPKAIKSGDQLDILSGNINIKTCGMGGEGLESKNGLYIVGGNITLDTFDDGANGEKSIEVYGGNIYCCSQDNDGFDSNGCINIFGGNIFSVSLHPKNESFDTEGNTLNIYAGTLLGIGGGCVYPETSYIPFYSYPKWTSGILQEPMPEISLRKDCLLQIMQDGECVMSGRVPADMNAAIITVASDKLRPGQEYKVVETDEDDNCNNSTLKFIFKPQYYF